MAFPSLTPTARQFSPGNFPSKQFSTQSGAEIRILYGAQRVNATMQLTFSNIVDTNVSLFLQDYAEQLGTFRTFTLPSTAFDGWQGTDGDLDAPSGTSWRYEAEPQVQAVRPGISTVTVSLRAVA